MIRLDSVITELQSGKRPKGGAKEYGIPSLGAEHLDKSGGFKLSKLKYVDEDFFRNMKSGIIQKDDIIIVKDGSTTGKVSYVQSDFPLDETSINEHLFILRLDNSTLPKYVFYHLYSNIGQRQILEDFRGATVGGISKGFVKNIKLPLPSIDQQKKIASILDVADAYRQKTKALIEKYDELTQSLFMNMFGDPVKNEMRWEKMFLSSFIKSLKTGVSVNSTNEEYNKERFGILKTSCVYSGVFNPNETKVIRDDEYNRMKLNPTANSIIISRMNTTELVGRSAYVPIDFPNLFLPDRLWQTKKGELDHNVSWFSHALSFNSFRDEIGKISSGTSGSMKNISQKNYLNLKMIYPPFILQNQFAGRVQAIEAQKAQAQASLAQSEDLFNSLLQRAFKGELTS